jgi:hypothetical protein
MFRTAVLPTSAVSRQQYVVHPDAPRFLTIRVSQASPPPINLIVNWKPKP